MSAPRWRAAAMAGAASRPVALAQAVARITAPTHAAARIAAPVHAVASITAPAAIALVAALAAALTLALPTPARAGNQMRLGLCASRVDPDRHPVLTGVAANWVAGPETFLSFESEFSATINGHAGLGSFTFGPQLGSTDGRVRPYVNAFIGFTGGSFGFAGWANGYSVGAVGDVSDRLALWAEVRSVNSGNWEDSGHFAQARLGIAFGSRAGRARSK